MRAAWYHVKPLDPGVLEAIVSKALRGGSSTD